MGERRPLSEFESKRLLADYGIPVTREYEVRSEEEAVRAGEGIGYPVVLKVSDPLVTHKTESGGVILGIADREALTKNFGALPKAPAFLVQEQVGGGLELILGGRRDPTFGPVILLGLGGIFTEVLKTAVTRICPLDRETAL